mmetsp:Transcript_36062/g.84222  ORF Transcript_36062/g.84222 Transcript_36062/m.84222 type:complete len:635 (+) Transcript_36062:226-2130(+)
MMGAQMAALGLEGGSTAAVAVGGDDAEFVPSAEEAGGLPSLPFSQRVQRMQAGCKLVKAAQGNVSRSVGSQFAYKDVRLSADCRQLTWDNGKRKVDLSQVLRISLGLESRTLQKIGASLTDMPSYHWFSLHTASRSYDFGAKDCGDENEMVVLWVLTLEELLSAMSPSSTSVSRTCLSLSHAQQQWQRFEKLDKEWPCVQCTYLNPASDAPPPGVSPTCASCGATRPKVTLCPCMTPLLPMLVALGNTLGVRAFESSPDAHLLWFLLQGIETSPPAPYKWRMGTRKATGEPVLGLSAPGVDFTVMHPHIAALHREADEQRSKLTISNGAQVPPPPSLFVSPEEPFSERSVSEMEDYEEALAAAVSMEGSASSARAQAEALPAAPFPAASVLEAGDAADVFRYCLSGRVEEVRRFLELGGHADTVYKSAYGWDVGAAYSDTKPTDGATVLNYVATWTDVIGPPAAPIAALLVEAGADPRRDDGLEQWFTPLHNAVANGAREVAEVILKKHPEAVDLTTGEGQTPLFVLHLCDDAEEQMATLGLLIRYRANLAFAEPFFGNTALHIFAQKGFPAMVGRLLEHGAPSSAKNEAGRTALEEAQHELCMAELQNDSNTAARRAKLRETIEVMEIASLAQ